MGRTSLRRADRSRSRRRGGICFKKVAPEPVMEAEPTVLEPVTIFRSASELSVALAEIAERDQRGGDHGHGDAVVQRRLGVLPQHQMFQEDDRHHQDDD